METESARPWPLTRRSRAPGARIALSLLGLLCLGGQARANPVRIRVKARPRLVEVAATRVDDRWLEVRGRLLDDLGAPMPNAELAVLDGEQRLSLFDCAEAPGGRSRNGVETDASGRACARARQPADDGALTLSFSGDSQYSAASAPANLARERAALGLDFGAAALELDLDAPSHRLEIHVATPPPFATPLPEPELRLELLTPRETLELSPYDWSRTGSRIGCSIDSETLGGPGPARLRVSYAGSPSVAPDVSETVALRVAQVSLAADVHPRDPNHYQVRVVLDSPHGPVDSGRIRATTPFGPIAASDVSAGTAWLLVETSAEMPPPRLELSYEPDDPWWLAPEPLVVVLAAQTALPSRWPPWLWLVALAPIGALCLARLQRPAARRERPPARESNAPARPGLQAVRIERHAATLAGRVLDAHTGEPVAQARVVVTSASGRPLRARLDGDAAGRYEIDYVSAASLPDATLVIRAPLHADFECPLPAAGFADVALVSRRRALVEQLVRWARGRGAPWHSGPEPTPAEVARVALRRGDSEIASWARSVEAAAFDPSEVDARRESEVRSAEPPSDSQHR